MKVNSQALKAIREKDGHSTRSLAEVSGISQQRIWQLENGGSDIRPRTASQLAVALSVPTSAITLSETPEVAA